MYERIDHNTPVVQKYGGTSVADADRIKAVAKRVARVYRHGHTKLAIVVSARSGQTNRLVALVEEVNSKAPGIAYDLALAAGEQVSVALLTAALHAEGIPARPFLAYQLGIQTDEMHAKARIKTIMTDGIEQAWQQKEVAVVAGFQGIAPDMSVTTLGRGGSDTSAVALAVALRAGFCEINTDVDGVFTADPRIVPQARMISKMDFEVALEMASLGSKVLHPRCVELGAKWQMPIVVRNSFKDDDHQRTWIMNFGEQEAIEAPVVSGVTTDRDVTRVTLAGLPSQADVISKTFAALAAAGVNIDIIIHDKPDSGPHRKIGFTIGGSDFDSTKSTLTKLAEQEKWTDLEIATEGGLAKVSVVGVGMRSHSGVAGRTFAALTKANIDIHMISTSEIKISCVVDAQAADSATKALHAEFISAE